MLKLVTVLALLFCFVYSNNEQNDENQLHSSELQPPLELNEENKNTVHTIKGHYTEEKQTTRPCKKNRNRGFDDKDSDLFDTLPITATVEEKNTASIGNKIITSSIHGANYNYKNENTEAETDNSDPYSTNCDCDNCVSEANKKVLEFESLAFDGHNPLNKAEINTKTGESELGDSNSIPSNKLILHESQSDDRNNIPLDNAPLNIYTDEPIRPCNKGFILNTRRRKCGRIGSENLSIAPITRRILPGIIENPTNQELEDNKLYQDAPHNPLPLNNNDEMDIETRHNYFPKAQKVGSTYDIDLVHNMNINDGPQQIPPIEDAIESQLTEPTKGEGIYDMKDARVMLLENSRVCYACSTMSDPTCWSPDRRTTVKYCQKGHLSCLTKTFKHQGKSVIIRDCGSYCVNFPGVEEDYGSCSICHTDLCNGAPPITIFSTGIVIIFFGILFTSN